MIVSSSRRGAVTARRLSITKAIAGQQTGHRIPWHVCPIILRDASRPGSVGKGIVASLHGSIARPTTLEALVGAAQPTGPATRIPNHERQQPALAEGPYLRHEPDGSGKCNLRHGELERADEAERLLRRWG